MNLYSFSTLCFSFGVTLIAILALVKRRDNIAYRFFIFSLSICGWSYLFSIWASQQFSYEITLFLARTAYLFVMFIPVTWLHFVFEFIGKKEPIRFFYAINYCLALVMAFFCYSKFMISGMPPFIDFKYFPAAGFVHHIHVTHFFILVFIGLFYLLKKYWTAKGLEKDQLRYFAWGALIGFVSGGSIYVTYYRVHLPMYYLVLLPLYPIFTGIALIRYGLFDVQQIADAFQREKITVLGIMAASLNHEMRNPLYIAKGKIEGYRDAVEHQPLGIAEKEKKAEELVSSVAHQLDRTLDIMQRFSDFARPQSMSQKEDLKLDELFQEASDLVSYEIQRKKISIAVEAPPGLRLRAHKRQMEEVLVNLMINAAQAFNNEPCAKSHEPSITGPRAMDQVPSKSENHGASNMAHGPETSPLIKISASQVNGQVKIIVADNGPGITEETQKRLFEPFFSTKAEKGTGLGLYITKQLVEKNGGKIAVKSKKGSGTAFLLTFEGVN